MFVRSQGMQMTPALNRRIAAALLVAVPSRIFDVDSKVDLFTSGPAMDYADHLVADFPTPVFNGYAAVTLVTPSGPLNVPGAEVELKLCSFVATSGGAIPGEDIAGYRITDTDGVTVLGWELFAQPIPIAAIGDSVILELLLGVKGVMAGEQG